MSTVIYPEKKTFFPLGKNQIIAFLNEKTIENWQQPNSPEGAEPITGYCYSGTRKDGGTVLPCENASDYGCLVNAIIRSRFSLSEEMAMNRHFNNSPEEYAQEWEDYSNFCEAAKLKAKEWLGIE